MTNIGDFYLKIFSFLEVKFSIYLNRLVFVMLALPFGDMGRLCSVIVSTPAHLLFVLFSIP